MEDILKFKDRREREVFERLFKWYVSGGGRIDPQTVSGDTTLRLFAFDTQIDVDTTAGDVTITLPSAATHIGKEIHVIKTAAANTVTVAAADLINGSATFSWTSQWQSMTFAANGTTWRIR